MDYPFDAQSPSGATGIFDWGGVMRFQKKPWSVTLKRLAMSFDVIVGEVERGRVVNITSPHGPGAVLVPMSRKQKVAFRHRPSKPALLSHKPSRRW